MKTPNCKLPAPITLPEALYLEILVGQMSAQETTVFDCPSIGDDLSAKDGRGRAKFTLERIKRSIDDCSNPPHFRGVRTPVTDIMDPTEPRTPKEKRDQSKHTGDHTKPSGHKANPDKDRQRRDQSKNPTKAHLARRPAHEQPNKFPTGLKRPDLDAVVEGKKIASEAQRQLYDDIKRGQCTRCHKGGHVRRDCKEPQEKWEEKFDKEKEKYWDSVAKWQSKATTGSTTPPTPHAKPSIKTNPPKSVDKPEHRASSITSDSEDDDTSSYPPLHYRLTIDDPEEADTLNDDSAHDNQDDNDLQNDDNSLHFSSTSAAPTPAALAAIFTAVNRQLDTLPLPETPATVDDANAIDDARALAVMDAHIRAILASADPMLYALNTAIGHTVTHTSPTPLTDETMAAEIADMYAHYYADTSSSEDESLFPYAGRPPLSEDQSTSYPTISTGPKAFLTTGHFGPPVTPYPAIRNYINAPLRSRHPFRGCSAGYGRVGNDPLCATTSPRNDARIQRRRDTPTHPPPPSIMDDR